MPSDCALGSAGASPAGSTNDTSNVIGAAEHLAGAHETFIQVEQLQKGLCGVSRPHFFRGVATVCQCNPFSALLCRLCSC